MAHTPCPKRVNMAIYPDTRPILSALPAFGQPWIFSGMNGQMPLVSQVLLASWCHLQYPLDKAGVPGMEVLANA